MSHEKIKTGVFRIFVVLTIIWFVIVIVGLNPEVQDIDRYRFEFFFMVVPTGLWSIYFFGLWIIKGFLGKK
jgi:hypothetical protein